MVRRTWRSTKRSSTRLPRGRRALSAHLRLDEPTLSLGYFQRLAEVRADPRGEMSPWCAADRRGAIWHHHELTYALAVPAGTAGAAKYAALSRGARCDRGGSGWARCSRRSQGRSLSSRHVSEADPYYALLTAIRTISYREASSSLAGAAPARGAVLQHGSVLLHDRFSTPELPVSAMSRTFTRIRENGQTGCLRASRMLGMRPVAISLPTRFASGHGTGADHLSKSRLDGTTLNHVAVRSTRSEASSDAEFA